MYIFFVETDTKHMIHTLGSGSDLWKKVRILLQKGTYSELLCNTLIQYSDTIDVTMLKYLDKYCSLLALTIQLALSFDILLGSFLS